MPKSSASSSVKRSLSSKRKVNSGFESSDEDFREDPDAVFKEASKTKKKTKKTVEDVEDDVIVPVKKKKSKAKKAKQEIVSDASSEDESKTQLKKVERKKHKVEDVHSQKITSFFQTKSPSTVHEVTKTDATKKISPSGVKENVLPQTSKAATASSFFGSTKVKQSAITKPKILSPAKEKDSIFVEDSLADDELFKALADTNSNTPTKLKRKSSFEQPVSEKPARTPSSKLLSGSPHSNRAAPKVTTAAKSPKSSTTSVKTPEKKITIENVKEHADSPKVSSSTTPKTPSSKSKPSTSTTPPSGTKHLSTEGEMKRKQSYMAYVHREGPQKLGERSFLPESLADKPVNSLPHVLAGITLVITGILEYEEKDKIKEILENLGARITGSVSGKTSYLVVGREAGESKLEKANQLNTPKITEDQLIDLIERKLAVVQGSMPKMDTSLPKQSAPLPKTTKAPSPKVESDAPTIGIQNKGEANFTSEYFADKKDVEPGLPKHSTALHDLWVDEYRPRTLKQLIGQQGDKSPANKLLRWLTDWWKHQAAGTKPNPFSDTGAGFKAALLSGPPGIGKTTTAQVIVKAELGLDFVEMNASDTRNKSCLHDKLTQILGSRALVAGHTQKKHVLIMDEVDGMSGNADRGGIAEMITLIKTSRIPVICICNDRHAVKIRSLANHCFDLKFLKPRMEAVRGALMSIAFKQGLKVTPSQIEDLIASTNQDIRQCVGQLQMVASRPMGKQANSSSSQNDDGYSPALKDTSISAFEAIRRILSCPLSQPAKPLSIMDRLDLFFQDYSLMPLFVQENYLRTTPAFSDKTKASPIAKSVASLKRMARAANSLSMGDIAEKRLRGNNDWSLLQTVGLLSCALPSRLLCGDLHTMPQFPAWFGRNSNQGKCERLLTQLSQHACLVTMGCSRGAFGLDYVSSLKHGLVEPLKQASRADDGAPEKVKASVSLMSAYYLTRPDFDSILELATWSPQTDPLASVSSKTKAAFTRLYNKTSAPLPYADSKTSTAKGKKGGTGDDGLMGADNEEDGGGEDVEEEDDTDIKADAMIKPVTKKAPAKSKTTTAATSKAKKKK